jgi:hypothetical protein
MKRWRWLSIGLLVVALATAGATTALAAGPDSLWALRLTTARFHDPRVAQAAGYVKVAGLDYCFTNPGVGGMGYHLINTGKLDTQLDPLHPEAMVYAPGDDGGLQLVAVEWIVPAALWDQTHTELPSVMGIKLHLNAALGVYILHAWIWKNNPSGMFQDWNPRVSCAPREDGR